MDKRYIQLKQINQIVESDFPIFIKPVIPKMFIAGIFQTLNDFKQVVTGLQETEEILVSSIIENISAEARSYIKDGVVKDIALYEGSAVLTSGRQFVSDFIDANKIIFQKSLSWILHLVKKLVGLFLNLMHVGVLDLITARLTK